MWCKGRNSTRRGVRGDVFIALALAVAVGAFGAWYLFTQVGTIGLDHGIGLDWFSPAILFAAGRGLETPQLGVTPAIDAFINQQTLRLDPDDLPAEVPTWGMSPFCSQHRYLVYAVGMVWKVLGIGWENLKWLPVLAYMIAAAMTYGLFRLAMGRSLSLLGAALYMMSPPVVAMLPSVRDFCKMPFLLAVMLIAGWLLTRKVTRRGLYGAALAAGFTLGIGVGFRSDVMIGVVPLVGAVLFAWCPVKYHLLHRGMAALLVVGLFLFLGRPVLDSMAEDHGAVSSHTLAQGLSEAVNDGLEFGGAPYELVLTTNDNEVHSLINTYAQRENIDVEMPNYLSAGYGEAGRRFFLHVARTFPADMLGRAWAAVAASFRIQERTPEELAGTPLIDNAFITRLGTEWRPLALLLSRGGLFFAGAGLLVLAAVRLRYAFAALLLTLFFCGYLSILFQFRHAFHVGFVALWYFLLCAQALVWGAQGVLSRRARAQRGLKEEGNRWSYAGGRAALFAALVFAGFLTPLSLSRIWQQHTAGVMVRNVAEAPRSSLAIEMRPGDGGVYAVPNAPLPELADAEALPRMTVPFAYLAADFKDATAPLCMVICYGDGTGQIGHTERLWYTGCQNGNTVRYYFPVYRWAEVVPPKEGFYLNIEPEYTRVHFLGLWVAEPFVDRFTGLEQVANPGALPFLPYLAVTEGTGTTPLFRQFGVAWPGHPCGYPQRVPPAG